jgi:hypothetical protein
MTTAPAIRNTLAQCRRAISAFHQPGSASDRFATSPPSIASFLVRWVHETSSAYVRLRQPALYQSNGKQMYLSPVPLAVLLMVLTRQYCRA